MTDKQKCADCYDFEERAAIMEYLAEMSRQEAERCARRSTCAGCVSRVTKEDRDANEAALQQIEDSKRFRKQFELRFDL